MDFFRFKSFSCCCSVQSSLVPHSESESEPRKCHHTTPHHATPQAGAVIDVDNDECADAIEVIEIEQDEEKSKDAAAAVLAELAPKEMGESLDKEKACIAASRNVAQNILDALSNYRAQGWSSAAVHDMRVREAKSLVDNTVLPNFSVVTVGNTGAGK